MDAVISERTPLSEDSDDRSKSNEKDDYDHIEKLSAKDSETSTVSGTVNAEKALFGQEMPNCRKTSKIDNRHGDMNVGQMKHKEADSHIYSLQASATSAVDGTSNENKASAIENKEDYTGISNIGNRNQDQSFREKYKPKSKFYSEDNNDVPKVKIFRTSEESGDKTHGSVIAAHYSTAETGLEARNMSRIVFLRNFNNWIKGMLLNQYIRKLQDKNRFAYPIYALDLCCGKGGDLFKWKIGKIRHLVCSDIAEVAVDNCRKRYQDMRAKEKEIYNAEFIACDLTKMRLRGKYEDPSMKFDIVSCQFAFHYSFESLPQAECLLQNATECLKTGGYFIGTIPDANAIVHRRRESKSNRFGNSVYSITFDESVNDDHYPLFGAKYNFDLDGVVNCPEFLVHFPTFQKLAEKFNLRLVKKSRFSDYFKEMKQEGFQLLRRMSSLELYPPRNETELVGSRSEDYNHAKVYLSENPKCRAVKTLSAPEWEVASLYLVFAFQKIKSPDT